MRPKFRLTLLLTAAVVIFTVIGTLSHELGHAAVALSYGWEAEVHYAYTSYPDVDVPAEDKQLFSLAKRYEPQIRAHRAFPGDTLYYKLQKQAISRSINVVWGGPAQTMLTGTFGLVLILSQWSRFRRSGHLKTGQWLLVFLALFWLRQPANLLSGGMQQLITGKWSVYDDESQLSVHYGLPVWSVLAITSFLAAAVCIVVYRAVPPAQRGSFLLAFLIGAPLGYLSWLEWLGPMLMP